MSFLRDPKRLLATLIAAIAGILVLLNFSATIPEIDALARLLTGWSALLVALALVVGLLSIVGNHLVRVVRRQPDWGYSLVLLTSLTATIVVGVVVGWSFDPQTGNFGLVWYPTLIERSIRDLFTTVYQPLAASFLALLAFFSLSAALRALRNRTRDALIIVGVAFVALVTAALPQAAEVPYLNDTVRWLNDYVAVAGARGLLIGSAIGALVAGVRVLLGFDQPFIDR